MNPPATDTAISMSGVQNAPASADEGDSASRDMEKTRTNDTANPQKPPEAGSEGESATGSKDAGNERLISALQACFADLAMKNEEQIDRVQTAMEGIKAKGPVTDKRTNFWNLYKTLADEHDKEFLEKYSSDLDSSLIFAGLFSAVSSAFIIQIQPELQPDPNDMNQALMRLLIHTVNDSIFSGPDILIPDSSASPPALVVVAQSLLYVSLSCTLLAALLAVLGKQWLMYYSAAGERGTIEARGLERQRKFDGLRRWQFDMVLQMFPLLLQISLLLFAAALSIYLWTVHRSLATIVLSLTSFGTLANVFLLLSAVVYQDSRFQTPLRPLIARLIPKSLWIQWSGFFGRATMSPRHFLESRVAGPLRSFIKHGYSACSRGIHQSHGFLAFSSYIQRSRNLLPSFNNQMFNTARNRREPAPLLPPPQPSPEVPAVAWVLETSTDPRMIRVAAEMAVDLQWQSAMYLKPQMRRLLDSFLACFHQSEGYLTSVRDGMAFHAIHLGRAYCTLRCAHQFRAPDDYSEPRISWDRWTPGLFTPELENVLQILQGIPSLNYDTGLAKEWALHVIPSFHYENTGRGIRSLTHFLTQCQHATSPLDEAAFANYLFCVNTFLSATSRHDMVWVNKRPLQEKLFELLFKTLSSKLHKYEIKMKTAARIISITGFLDGAAASPLSNRQHVLLQFCSSIPQSNGWIDVVMAIWHIPGSLGGSPETKNNGTDASWVYKALDSINIGPDDQNQWDTKTINAVSGLLTALIYYRSPPAKHHIHLLLRALSVPGRISNHAAGLLLAKEVADWFQDDGLRPILKKARVWADLGRIISIADRSFGVNYIRMGHILARQPEWRGEIRPGLCTWIVVFFQVKWRDTLNTQASVERYNSVLTKIWNPDTGGYHFINDVEKALGQIGAMVAQYMPRSVAEYGWHGVQPVVLATTANFNAVFSAPLRNSLRNAATSARRPDAGDGLSGSHEVLRKNNEGFGQLAKLLDNIASEMLNSQGLDYYDLRDQFDRDIMALENSIRPTSILESLT